MLVSIRASRVLSMKSVLSYLYPPANPATRWWRCNCGFVQLTAGEARAWEVRLGRLGAKLCEGSSVSGPERVDGGGASHGAGRVLEEGLGAKRAQRAPVAATQPIDGPRDRHRGPGCAWRHFAQIAFWRQGHVPQGAVMLMRGRNWPKGRNALHRRRSRGVVSARLPEEGDSGAAKRSLVAWRGPCSARGETDVGGRVASDGQRQRGGRKGVIGAASTSTR